MPYDLQFVDQISTTPTVRLNLNAAPWRLREGTDFGMPELKRSVVSTLLVDGDRYPAAAYGNRVLSLLLRVDAATDDDAATQLQLLYRELNRANNILLYRPGTSEPTFFPTFRCGPDSVEWNPFTKEVRVQIPAGPFGLGERETLPAVTVYNDPAEGNTLNANPFFETDASNWSALGGTVARSTAQFHEGAASLLFTPDGVTANVDARSENVAVTVGQQYRASAWVRSAVARSVAVNINWRVSGGGPLSLSTTTVALAAGTWTLMEVTATAPALAAFALVTVSMGSTPPAGNTLHIDEARLRLAGGAGGMCFDVTSPKGDVEAPLYLRVRASDVTPLPEDPDEGRRQSAVAVRRRGTPSAMPAVLQAESMTATVDTSVQPAADGSAGQVLRVSFATDTSLQTRASISPYPASPSVDARGTYRVFVRCRKSVSTATVQLQLQYFDAGATVSSDVVAGPEGAVWRWVDMGLVQLPMGYDPVVDGLSGVPMPVGGLAIRLLAARATGTGNLDIDTIMLMPADDRLCLVKWPQNGSESYYVVDPVAGQVYGVGVSGEVRSGLPELIGGPPMVSPGVANRVWVWRDVGPSYEFGDSITASMQVTPYYWPQYLTVRPVSS